jgi:serine/threonine protein phosphatase PrpC
VVLVVADGAGGIEDGEVASRSVVDAVRLPPSSNPPVGRIDGCTQPNTAVIAWFRNRFG